MQQPADIVEENERLRVRLQQLEDVVGALRGVDVGASLDRPAATEAYRFCHEMLEQFADAVIAVDENDHIIYLNAAAEQLYGITASDVLGRPQPELFTALWVESADEAAAATALREHGEWCGEIIHVGHNGRELEVECRITALKNHLGQPNGRMAVIRDVSKRKLNDQRVPVSETRSRRLFEAARTSDNRQAFLLKLSDTLRPIGDALEIQSAALRVLGEHLAVSRAFFNEIDEGRDAYVIHRTYANGVAPLDGHFRLSDLKWTTELAGAGQIVVFDDARTDPRLSDVDRATYAAMKVAAGIAVPLIKDGRWVAGLGVHHATPKQWTPGDIELVRDVAERTWAAVERAKAETALHDREADLARVQRIGRVGGVNIVVAPGLWSRRSPEYLRLHGLPQSASDESHADWLARVLPEDREGAERALFEALNGNAVTYESEYRIVRPSDGAVRWIEARADIERDADGTALRLVGAHTDITEQKTLQQALKANEARQAFLLKFSDSLRPLGDPVEVQTVALHVLSEHFGAVRAQYWEVEPDGHHAHSEGGYAKEGPRVLGRVRLNDFGVHVIKTLAAGLTVTVSDMSSDPSASEEVLAAYDAVGVRAFITVPLVKAGRLVALFTVHHTGAWDWTAEETVLIEEAAERTWAAVVRAQAEAALRDSEQRLRTLFDNMAEGFALFDAVRGPDGQIDDMLYREANRALQHQTGFDRATTIGRTLKEILTPSDAARFIPLLARAIDPGESGNIEEFAEIADRWFETSAYPHGPDKVAVFYRDISERKRAEIASREREAQQAFVLRFSDALRAEPSAEAMMDRAIQMLFQHMKLDRCYIGIYRLAEDVGQFPHQVHHDWLSPLPAQVPLSDFPEGLQIVSDRTLVIDDLSKMEGISDLERASFTGLGVGALINATLRKGENNPLWAIVAVSSTPRVWTPGEISLVEEVAERTWAAAKRARAKDRLQIAHDTFSNLIDRSPFGTYIIDADFRLVQMSEGGQKAFAILSPLIGRDFTEVVHAVWPEPFASEVIARFRHTLTTGEPYKAVTNEPRADIESTEAYDWKIERMVLPDGRLGVVCHFYDFTEKQQQEDRIKLLMGEVNHRSKNMLGLIQAIARQTAKTQPEHFLEVFGQRLQALSASQDLLVKGEWKAVQLDELIHSQLAHFGDEHDGRITIDGPLILITASASQSLGMAVHELATNATKFGALSNESGRVVISWSMQSDVTGQELFEMSWIESGGPPVGKPARRGFGSTVIDGMLKMSLGCDAEVDFAPTGLVWRIGCPAAGLIEGEVGPLSRPNGTAPSQEPAPVSGRRILVVEDEPLIAMDFSQTLSEAGFVVIGPANSVAQALALLAQFGCDAAMLDVNLGKETSEAIARELIRLGRPFVATCGYSREQMPGIMQTAPLLGKPVSSEMLIAEVERCLGKLY